jgi:signal transduction histidine kinase
VWGLRTQLEQVFRNLVGNAIKFVPATVTPVIDIDVVDRDDMVECAVRDNGIGIAPAHHTRVFEIFHRLHDAEVEGTGVGLALVKKIVESNAGQIWVESAKGHGATFRFTWPKAAPAA